MYLHTIRYKMRHFQEGTFKSVRADHCISILTTEDTCFLPAEAQSATNSHGEKPKQKQQTVELYLTVKDQGSNFY